MIQDRSPGRNWAGNYTYGAQKLHRPSTIEQVQEIIANAPRVRVLGSRHSFNDIADSSELISLEAMPMDVVVDHAADTVSFNAALKYGELVHKLNAEGVALHNLASLPHISIAGAVATATHGSGETNGNLATAVVGLELVTSGGEIIDASRGEPDFDGLVVGLGALGALTRITLKEFSSPRLRVDVAVPAWTITAECPSITKRCAECDARLRWRCPDRTRSTRASSITRMASCALPTTWWCGCRTRNRSSSTPRPPSRLTWTPWRSTTTRAAARSC